MFSLNIAQQGHPSEDPVIRALYCLEPQGSDVSQVCPLWLFVDRTLVKPWILWSSGINCVHVYDW